MPAAASLSVTSWCTPIAAASHADTPAAVSRSADASGRSGPRRLSVKYEHCREETGTRRVVLPVIVMSVLLGLTRGVVCSTTHDWREDIIALAISEHALDSLCCIAPYNKQSEYQRFFRPTDLARYADII
nr:hypothetical protein CFP56_76067 [Quercus suber]